MTLSFKPNIRIGFVSDSPFVMKCRTPDWAILRIPPHSTNHCGIDAVGLQLLLNPYVNRFLWTEFQHTDAESGSLDSLIANKLDIIANTFPLSAIQKRHPNTTWNYAYEDNIGFYTVFKWKDNFDLLPMLSVLTFKTLASIVGLLLILRLIVALASLWQAKSNKPSIAYKCLLLVTGIFQAIVYGIYGNILAVNFSTETTKQHTPPDTAAKTVRCLSESMCRVFLPSENGFPISFGINQYDYPSVTTIPNSQHLPSYISTIVKTYYGERDGPRPLFLDYESRFALYSKQKLGYQMLFFRLDVAYNENLSGYFTNTNLGGDVRKSVSNSFAAGDLNVVIERWQQQYKKHFDGSPIQITNRRNTIVQKLLPKPLGTMKMFDGFAFLTAGCCLAIGYFIYEKFTYSNQSTQFEAKRDRHNEKIELNAICERLRRENVFTNADYDHFTKKICDMHPVDNENITQTSM